MLASANSSPRESLVSSCRRPSNQHCLSHSSSTNRKQSCQNLSTMVGNTFETTMHGMNGKYDLSEDHVTEPHLRNVNTIGGLSIAPELFEKLYLSPKNRVHKDLRETFANPTPLALIGFVISLTPLSNMLLGWRGSVGGGASTIGAYFFFGGLCSFIGGTLEWVLGNTFSFVVFCAYGAFWLTFGTSLYPAMKAAMDYQQGQPATVAESPEYAASFAFFLVYMGVLSLVFLICSLRTNIALVLIFLTLTATFPVLAAADWQLSQNKLSSAMVLQKTGGGLAFASSLCAWYILIAQMLAAVDFPLDLPVGDLSNFIKPANKVKACLDSEA